METGGFHSIVSTCQLKVFPGVYPCILMIEFLYCSSLDHHPVLMKMNMLLVAESLLCLNREDHVLYNLLVCLNMMLPSRNILECCISFI